MKNNARAGFSLLEMAIVLIILGVVVGAAMPSILKYREQARFKETKERQEMIAHAVAAYAVLNKTLPCPADPSRNPAERGMSPSVCMAPASLVGIVPYRRLGLTESQVKDGFNRYMTYAIPAHDQGGAPEAGRNGSAKNICKLQASVPINLKGPFEEDPTRVAEGPTVAGRGASNTIAMVLISHGPNGHGAYTGNGLNKVAAENPGRKERVNGDSTLTFYYGPYRQGADSFGHIVKWVTAVNLISIYGRASCDSVPESQPAPTGAGLSPAVQHGLGDPFGRPN